MDLPSGSDISRVGPQACRLCGRVLGSWASLRKHMITHSSHKRFSCDFCGKKFGTNWNLKAHRRIHTGERPYICNECGQSFVHQKSLDYHKKKYHRKVVDYSEYPARNRAAENTNVPFKKDMEQDVNSKY